MARRYFVLWFAIYFHTGISQQVSSFVLYFQSNKNELSLQGKQKIDSVLKKLANIPAAYKINISGHTDNEGNAPYNENLSVNRAKKVRLYFMGKHFLAEHISCRGYSFTRPVSDNGSDQAKAGNRRVEVTISAALPDLKKTFAGAAKQLQVTMPVDSGGSFQYSSGSKITVPPNAFVTVEGKPVHGKIDLKYTEFRDPLDFVAGGIPMSFLNNEKEFVQFNSGGMFKVEAVQGGQTLKLKHKSTIKVDFAKTQSLPEMKLFSFDTLKGAWKEAKPISNPTATSGFEMRFKATYVVDNRRIPNKVVRRLGTGDSCILQSCTGTYFSIRKGLELASSVKPINLLRPQIYFKKMRDPRNHAESYSLKIISSTKNVVEFQVIPSSEESVYDNFRDYHWIYSSNKAYLFKKNWEKMVWLKVSMDYLNGDDFFLCLQSNSEKVTFALKARIEGKAVSKWQNHSENMELNRVKLLAQKADLEGYDVMFNNSVYKEDGINAGTYRKACEDSLFCFYQYSRQWMDAETGETSLNFKEWIDYFNANKFLMELRYLNLEQDSSGRTTFCLAQEKKWREDEIKRAQENKKARRVQCMFDSISVLHKKAQEEILGAQVEQLSIANLGIWNCDQIQRLKDPVYVKKMYRDKKGKKIEPVVVYIIDKEVSGVLTYNGYLNLSPYNFPVSSKSQNTLIAFDVNNKAYLCKAQQLSEHLADKKNRDIVLETLGNPESQIAAVLK